MTRDFRPEVLGRNFRLSVDAIVYSKANLKDGTQNNNGILEIKGSVKGRSIDIFVIANGDLEVDVTRQIEYI